MVKKILWIIVVAIIWIIIFCVDNFRIEKNEKPWFCFPIEVSSSGSGYYYGLGYKVYVTTKLNNRNKYIVDTIKLGHWFEDLKK